MSRADHLRKRISIDPDAAPPTPSKKAATSPKPEPQPPPVGDPAPADDENRSASTTKPSQRRAPAAPSPRPAWSTALDDPDITPGRRGFRSFYVEDEAFARFRAAIYWASRREEAVGEVPVNMSAAVTTFLEDTARELEERFNDGAVFRPTPDQIHAAERRAEKRAR